MSEEEIIKICKILCGKKNKKGKREYPIFATLQLQLDYSNDELAEAIEGLLDLYYKEKKKNKNSVSKDRINRKIEELKDNCYAESIEFNNDLIEILQELLEE